MTVLPETHNAQYANKKKLGILQRTHGSSLLFQLLEDLAEFIKMLC